MSWQDRALRAAQTPRAGDIGCIAAAVLIGGLASESTAAESSSYADEHVLRALRAGAAGFLLKDTPPADLITAVHRVAAGDAQLSPSVVRQLIANVTATQPRSLAARERLADLTDREHDIARAIGHGLTNAEIAARLYLSVPTVKAHVSAVLSKLDASNRVQVALLVHDAETSGDR